MLLSLLGGSRLLAERFNLFSSLYYLRGQRPRQALGLETYGWEPHPLRARGGGSILTYLNRFQATPQGCLLYTELVEIL